MITNIKFLKRYCKDYTQIENYAEAVKSQLRYDCHHKREIIENKSRKDLIAENLYYGRHPEELVFLEHGEHMRLHNKGENSPWLGKHPSEEARKKISDSHLGKRLSAETRKKISNASKGRMKGKHWHVENGKHVYTD